MNAKTIAKTVAEIIEKRIVAVCSQRDAELGEEGIRHLLETLERQACR